ncbi:hypothetical protein Efla_001777 [Eimeria flavescens]
MLRAHSHAWRTLVFLATAKSRRAAAASAAAVAAAPATAAAAKAVAGAFPPCVSPGIRETVRVTQQPRGHQQQRSRSSAAAVAAVAAAAAAADTPHGPAALPECHLTAAAAAARFALVRQLHDAAFWRELGASAEALLEALASGHFHELPPSSGSNSSSSSNSSGSNSISDSNSSRSSSNSNRSLSLYVCRSSGAAAEILTLLRRAAQQQQETAAAAAAATGWCIDTGMIHIALPLLLNSFKQMRVFQGGLFAAAERAALLHLHALPLHAVSLLCCSLAAAAAAAAAAPSVSFWLSAGDYCAEAAAAAAASAAAPPAAAGRPAASAPAAVASSSCFYALPAKLHAAAAAAAAAGLEERGTAAKAAAATSAAAYFHFVSWCLLLGAFARCGIPHQGLFEAGAPHLCCVLQQHKAYLLLLQQQQQQQLLALPPTGSNSHKHRQIVSPGALLTKAVHAFATFGYSHSRLLRSVLDNMSLISLTDEQLHTLRESMLRLRCTDPLLESLARTRLSSKLTSSSTSSSSSSSSWGQ